MTDRLLRACQLSSNASCGQGSSTVSESNGGGHQIQLPVATLGAFFGVGKGKTREAMFRFQTRSTLRSAFENVAYSSVVLAFTFHPV